MNRNAQSWSDKTDFSSMAISFSCPVRSILCVFVCGYITHDTQREYAVTIQIIQYAAKKKTAVYPTLGLSGIAA